MIHEIVVPFQLNTGPIEDRLRQHGYEELFNNLSKKLEESMVACLNKRLSRYYRRGTCKTLADVDWLVLVNERIDRYLADHSEEIVDEAALLLAMRGSRKKKWREVLAELKDEQAAQ